MGLLPFVFLGSFAGELGGVVVESPLVLEV